MFKCYIASIVGQLLPFKVNSRTLHVRFLFHPHSSSKFYELSSFPGEIQSNSIQRPGNISLLFRLFEIVQPSENYSNKWVSLQKDFLSISRINCTMIDKKVEKQHAKFYKSINESRVEEAKKNIHTFLNEMKKYWAPTSITFNSLARWHATSVSSFGIIFFFFFHPSNLLSSQCVQLERRIASSIQT